MSVKDDTRDAKKSRYARDRAPIPPRLFNVKDGGAYLGVSFWVLRGLLESGVIPTVKIPDPSAKDGRVIRKILVDRQDLDAFIERNKERAE